LLVSVLVCSAAALVGGFFGRMAGAAYAVELRAGSVLASKPYLYPGLEPVGMYAGAVSGAVAGLGWCAILLRRRMSYRRRPVLAGMLWGLVAGVVSTLAVHGLLMWAARTWAPYWLAIGVATGAPAGLILGALLGPVLLSHREA
jgi:hypothetical protein